MAKLSVPAAVVVLLLVALRADAATRRRLPESNLAYPVLITTSSGTTGSGFYVATNTAIYLVTAGHVLFGENGNPKAPTAELLSYGADPKDATTHRFLVNLPALQKAGMLLRHANSDVAVARIVRRDPTRTSFAPADEAVRLVSRANSALAVAPRVGNLLAYEDVMVGNEVIVFGYPTSLGLQQTSHFDHSRPLLRSGIVAGKNEKERTMVLDCPVYPGNSGGPVIGISSENPGTETFLVIGVVTQFVPLAEEWVNTIFRYRHLNLGNSGYSIAAPMDFVLELLDTIEKATEPPGVPVAPASSSR